MRDCPSTWWGGVGLATRCQDKGNALLFSSPGQSDKEMGRVGWEKRRSDGAGGGLSIRLCCWFASLLTSSLFLLSLFLLLLLSLFLLLVLVLLLLVVVVVLWSFSLLVWLPGQPDVRGVRVRDAHGGGVCGRL